MKTYREFITEAGRGYIVRDQVRRIRQQERQGLNPDNPSRMNMNLQFKDTVHQMTPKPIERTIRHFVPYEAPPARVNPSPNRGRLLRNIIPGGVKA